MTSSSPSRGGAGGRGGGFGSARVGVAERPYATLAAILGPAALMLVMQAAGLRLDQVGSLVAPFAGEWWRYLSAPWAYDDLGYMFVIALTLAIFAPPLERRLGSVPVAILLLACGALGMVAGNAVESIGLGDGIFIASGGNGVALGAVAAWTVLRNAESRDHPGDDYDVVGVIVFAAVLLALPLVQSQASAVAGVVGALVGAVAGYAAGSTRSAEDL